MDDAAEHVGDHTDQPVTAVHVVGDDVDADGALVQQSAPGGTGRGGAFGRHLLRRRLRVRVSPRRRPFPGVALLEQLVEGGHLPARRDLPLPALDAVADA
ncbi:hypothetical protein GCM10010365_54990 [Streptomyces poonensis]|uniref:Uncharacterized protein n=1 Tax=Streptomyces poonensis TaxID=68255 RepID=A0A918Q0R2_9ACTN|nr:hypothetical protein GCM10010365_54990 [Streptomyces poonensis]GLJ89729.1 hypothetical protein GCM10017589_23300 [Streptomyces poonensis]